MMVTQNADKGGAGGIEQMQSSVVQPQKLPHLEGMVALLDEIDRISEKTGEDKSGDWSGASGSSGGVARTGGQSGVSPRDQAIANLPIPRIMMRQLEAHILGEVKNLRREINKVTKLKSPGAAFQLNELYRRLRRMQSLLHDILEASYDVLKRLFVKVFIDKQPIL